MLVPEAASSGSGPPFLLFQLKQQSAASPRRQIHLNCQGRWMEPKEEGLPHHPLQATPPSWRKGGENKEKATATLKPQVKGVKQRGRSPRLLFGLQRPTTANQRKGAAQPGRRYSPVSLVVLAHTLGSATQTLHWRLTAWVVWATHRRERGT